MRITEKWVWVALAGAALLLGCSDDAENGLGDPTGLDPTDSDPAAEVTVGSLEVSAVTGGEDPDDDGYAVTLAQEGESLELDADGSVSFEELEEGEYEVELNGVAANCEVDGSNPRTVDVRADDTVSITFEVTCTRGERVAFVSDRGGEDELWVMNADGSDPVQVTDGQDHVRDPRWSPDGSRLAFVAGGGGSARIWVVEPDGSNVTNLSGDDGIDSEPRWSPDGSRIAFTSRSTFGSDADIWTMKPDGSTRMRITSEPGNELDLHWSPDGTRLVFTRRTEVTIDGSSFVTEVVWVAEADGSDATALTDLAEDGRSREPRWSPDGQRIAFRSLSGGDWEIRVMDADGSNKTGLTDDPGTDRNPVWSPDGERIGFESDRRGVFEVWVMGADGSDPTNLTNAPGADFDPAWSPDGERIVFTSDRTGDEEIWVMDRFGLDQVNLTDDPADDHSPRWRP